MDDFSPHITGAFKRLLPSAIGLAASSVYNTFLAANRQRKQAALDSRERFPTWKEPASMPRTSYRPRYASRKRYVRRSRVTRRTRPDMIKTLVRTTPLATYNTLATGLLGVSPSFTLGQVNTTDIVAAYRLFRLVKIRLHLVPRVDPGNSGLVNNCQAMIAAACDPEGASAPTSISQVTSYDNSYQKLVTAADRFTYTFYPKVVNVVDNAGATSAASSYATNPWLLLSTAGLVIPHRQLLLYIQQGNAVALSYDHYFEYTFQVKGLA